MSLCNFKHILKGVSNIRGEGSHLTPPQEDFMNLGKSWNESFAPFLKLVTPSRICEESPIQFRGLDITPSRLPQKALNPLWGKFERVTFPLSIEWGDSSLRSEWPTGGVLRGAVYPIKFGKRLAALGRKEAKCFFKIIKYFRFLLQ